MQFITTRQRRRLNIGLVIALASAHSAGYAQTLRVFSEPRPTAAIPAIVEAFRTHAVVAIAEAHGLREAGDFYIALVRNAALQRSINDIVVEFASGQSQPLLDRWAVDLDPVTDDSVRTIWRNTTKVASWESPIYARWLKAVRDVNRTLPRRRRLRVLASDTPIDWRVMHDHADWHALGNNNVTMAHIINDSVIAKGHKALVVLGGGHLLRSLPLDSADANATSHIDARFPGAMFVAILYTGTPTDTAAERRVAAAEWPTPSVVPLRNTWLANTVAGVGRFRLPLGDLADAVLYLGSARSLHIDPPAAGSIEPAYLRELDRRSWIEWKDSSTAREFLGPAIKR